MASTCCHGYLSEVYVEDATYVVPLPPTLKGVGVLLEPLSISEKGVRQALEIQRRLRIWEPARALVTGAGTVGLLAALLLKLEGLDVTVMSRRRAPYANSDLVERLGARYLSTSDTDLATAARDLGPFDLVVEATGYSPLVFDAAAALGPNGVLVLSGITAGERRIEIDANAINQGFVLGNKVMVGTVNASKADFGRGVDHLLAAQAYLPGWLDALLTTPVRGLGDPRAALDALADPASIKAYVEVSAG